MNDSADRQRLYWALVALLILIAFLMFLSGRSKSHGLGSQPGNSSSGDRSGGDQDQRAAVKRAQPKRALREGDPKGDFVHLFDKAAKADRFLISKAGYKNLIPDSDAPAGRDLWLQNEDGTERLVAEEVFRARFSPDGSKLAYTTVDATLHIEDLKGAKIAEVPRAYDPNWKPDSSGVAFALGPEGKPVGMPETLQLAVLDLKTGEVSGLTDGQWDDVRPDFSPSGDWLLFVSGGRTGLAAFWKVSANGGEPEQVTNVGLEGVNDLFVPTPYSRTLWTPDGWFIYDFKQGDREETWGLKLDQKTGKVLSSKKLGDGIDPRLNAGGAVTTLKHDANSEKVTVAEYTLP